MESAQKWLMFGFALYAIPRCSRLCPKRAMCASISTDGDTDWDFELPQSPTESWDLESIPQGDAGVWPNGTADDGCFPPLRLSSCKPEDFPHLQASVGRIYPSYWDDKKKKSLVKCPNVVQLANGLLVTAAHAVPNAVASKGKKFPLLQRNSSKGIPVQFSPTAQLLRQPLRDDDDDDHEQLTAHLLPAPTNGVTDKCPLTSVPWTTPSHPHGPDVRFLRPSYPFTSKKNGGGLSLSQTELKPGESVMLCAYMREYLSYAEASQWLLRSDDQLLLSIHPKLVELKQKIKFDDDHFMNSCRELARYVMEPWAEEFAACQSLSSALGNKHLIITKMFAFGKVLAVKDGMIATDLSCLPSCASGGALVRSSDPNALCGVFLGLPRDSPFEAGNFSVALSVQPPAFQKQLDFYL